MKVRARKHVDEFSKEEVDDSRAVCKVLSTVVYDTGV